MNVWDVGGQKSLRSYWRNYFESTDGLVWVVDSADKLRMGDCKQELHALLLEEVIFLVNLFFFKIPNTFFLQRLAGATLLIFANKQDIVGSLTKDEICEVIKN